MMTVFFILLALTFAGVLTELVAARRAPFGYQNESGFHFGGEHTATAAKGLELENPS